MINSFFYIFSGISYLEKLLILFRVMAKAGKNSMFQIHAIYITKSYLSSGSRSLHK